MKVVTGDFGGADMGIILDQLHEVIYSAKGQLSLVEVIGIIEIFKMQFYQDQTYDD